MSYNKKYLPQDKEDLEFINYLEKTNIEDIITDVPILLEWLQDGNWPQGKLIAKYLSPKVNLIKNEIIGILKGKDEMWKYWILNGLLLKTEKKLDRSIIEELEELYTNPSEDESEAEVDSIAYLILKKNV